MSKPPWLPKLPKEWSSLERLKYEKPKSSYELS